MGSAISRTGTLADTYMFDLHSQVQFTGHQLNDFAGIQSQQQAVGLTHAVQTNQAIGGGNGNNMLAPEQAALRNFTQLMVNILAYLGPAMMLIGGGLYGANFTMHFLDPVSIFVILYFACLCLFYFVVSYVQTMRAYIATAKLFFLGSLFGGLIGGVLAFAVYKPPKTTATRTERNEIERDAVHCSVIHGTTVEGALLSAIHAHDSNLIPCLPDELNFPTDLLRAFSFQPSSTCARCEGQAGDRALSTKPKGRLQLYNGPQEQVKGTSVQVVFEYTGQALDSYIQCMQIVEKKVRELAKQSTPVSLVSVATSTLLDQEDTKRLRLMGVDHHNSGKSKESIDILVRANILVYSNEASLGYISAMMRPKHWKSLPYGGGPSDFMNA